MPNIKRYEIDKVKSKIHKMVEALRQELIFSPYYVYEDLSISDEPTRLSFAGWSTTEGYENYLKTLSQDIENLVELVYLQDGVEKMNEVTEWIVERLSVKEFRNYQVEPPFPVALDESKISDTIAVMLPLFASQKQQLYTTISDQFNNLLKDVRKPLKITKVRWLGSQKDLAELFGILIMRGWIKQPDNLSNFADMLSEIFDLTPTMKESGSNVVNNLRKHLQPIEIKGKTKFSTKASCAFTDIIANKITI